MASHTDTRRGRYDFDGLVNEIYNLIWTYSISGEFHSNILEGIYIPETVVIEQGFPRVWFSWASDQGELEKKLGKEIVLSKVYNQWAKGHDPSLPVAEFLSPRFDPLKGDATLTKEYFDAEGLLKFLQTRAHGVTGLLQKFVVPKPAHNVVFQATWTPHHMLCSARRNVNNMQHIWVDMNDRICTFDGPPSLSVPTVVSPFVQQKIQRELEKFATHVREHQRAFITGMVCFLKINQDGMLHLMQCTSLRLAKDGYQPVAPLDLTVRFAKNNKPREADVLVFRYERKVGGRTDLPRIDLTNVTDKSLDALDLDTSDMLYLPPSKHESPGKRESQRMIVSKASSPKSNSQDHDSRLAFYDTDQKLLVFRPREQMSPDEYRRRISIGLPDVGKEFPNEWAILIGFLEDIVYRTHWFFFENGCCDTGQKLAPDPKSIPPFEFLVPEEVMAILGYEGVQQFMIRYGAEDAGSGSYTLKENGEVMQQMKLRLRKPSATMLDLENARQFAIERLTEGLPRYEGGIDWERIRERKGPRRTTQWMMLVGATEGALRTRQKLKKKLKRAAEEERAAQRLKDGADPNEFTRTVTLLEDDFVLSPLKSDGDYTSDAPTPPPIPTRMTHTDARSRLNSNVIKVKDALAFAHASQNASYIQKVISGDGDVTPVGDDLASPTSNEGLALFSKHPNPPMLPQDPKPTTFLRGHAREQKRPQTYRPGMWKMNASFPSPPKVPRARRQRSPKKERKPAFPTSRTTLRSGAEQLDFWCQL